MSEDRAEVGRGGQQRGLHGKYEVYEDGEPVEECFVLEPDDDPAARAALIEYALETSNDELAQDLRDWVVEICKRDHVRPDGSHVDRYERELLGEQTVTFQCGVAANPQFDESDGEYCDHEPEEIELDEPAYREDGQIFVPGRPSQCPECGNPHDFEFNGLTVVFDV